MRRGFQTVTRSAAALLLAMMVAPVVEAPDLVAFLGPAATPAKAARAEAPGAMLDQPAHTSGKRLEPIRIWEGISSWYGEDFDGRPTATREAFDMYGNTAAHLSLPLGSIVRVVYPRTGRSQIVRINDRGPYIEGREIDVSYEVARELGFDRKGLALVRIELLKVPRHSWKQRRAD